MDLFNKLVFRPHTSCKDGTRARLDSDNGYGVSVITGSIFYTSEAAPYEVAIMKDGDLCYTTYITDDVLGYQTAEQVDAIMRKVEALRP